MAAFLPERELQAMFAKGMLSLTANSITTEQAFREHLEQIRQYGYSIDDEEGELGVRCVAAPIFTDERQVFGAISLTTLKGNLPMQKIPEYGEKLIETAKVISASLGFKA